MDIPNVKKIRVPVTDKLDPNRDLILLKQNMNKIIDFIDEKIEENNIFIYCYNGLTVSPLIVSMYMIKKGNISKDSIRDILKSKNQNICLDFDLSMF